MKKQTIIKKYLALTAVTAILVGGFGDQSLAQNRTEIGKFFPSLGNRNFNFRDAPPVSNFAGFDTKNLASGIAIQDDADFPKPDFREMEKWFEIQKYEYKILNQRLNIVVKAKADRDDRPHYFNIDFYDADGARVISTNYLTEEYVAETGQIEKIWAFTPSESQMKKVKKVVVTRVVN